MDDLSELEQSIERLTKRVEQLEGQLRDQQEPRTTEAAPAISELLQSKKRREAEAAEREPSLPTVAPSDPAASSEAPTSSGGVTSRAVGLPGQSQSAEPHSRKELIDRAVSAMDSKQDSKSEAESSQTFEQLIGGRVFAAIGALVVIISVGLFFKLAWDQGWLGRMPDEWKVTFGVMFGASLLVAGEYAFRRINAIAATGLYATGVGVVYISAFASYGFLHLVERPTAFTLLVLTAMLGVAVSVRAKLAFVAAVSIVGGYIAPLLLNTSDPPPVGLLPGYWLMLLVIGLTLSAKLGRGFHGVRTLVWWGTMIFGSYWVAWLIMGSFGVQVEQVSEQRFVALVFLPAVWLAIHAELIVSAKRSVRSQLHEGSENAGVLASTMSRLWASSLSTSSWCVGLSVLVIQASTRAHLDWAAPAVGFVVTLQLALILVGSIRLLRDEPRNDIERLGAVLAATAGALLAVTIALALDGRVEVATWFAIAIASAVAARRIKAHSLDFYAFAVLLFGSAAMLEIRWIDEPQWSKFGLAFTQGSLLMLGGAVAWGAVAVLMRWSDTQFRRHVSLVYMSVALVFVYVMPLHAQSEAVSIAWLWLGLSGVLAAARRLDTRYFFDRFAIAGLAAASGAWFYAFVEPDWSILSAPIVFNEPVLLALVICGAAMVIALRLIRRGDSDESAKAIGGAGVVGATILLLVMSSLEVARAAELFLTHDPTAQRAAVSIWWGLFAFPLLGIGFWQRIPMARYAGLALLGVGTAKAVMFDLQEVSPGWRVGSFMALGLLMLIVAVAYGKLVRLVEPDAET